MGSPQDQGFTGAGTNGPGTTGLGAIASSLQAEFSSTNAAANTGTLTDAQSSATAISASSATGSTATSPTTFATSVTSATGVGASSTTNSGATTATNVASNTSGAVTVSEKSCSGISCSSGLKAAVAVPVVVAALAGIFLFFFCIRRRRKNSGATVSEKKPKKPGKKWSRHLRAFSFDAELLMGGRFSSSNSMRSRDPSVRSAGNTSHHGAQSAEPSLHSIEEVAPPYRDAVSHAAPAGVTQARPGEPVTSIAADPIPRPLSTGTAPPPYGSIVGGIREAESPAAASNRNPFADSAPVSPIEGSPFNDPPEDAARPAISRNSSMYQSVNADDHDTLAPSDAGSIRQAQVGRRVSARLANDATGGSS